MPKMQIVTDEMLNRANRIGQNTSNILEKQNMVTNLFKNMGKNFSGKIPGLMTQHMLAMDKEYQTMNGILKNYKDFLEDSARNYEWKEDELARFAESLGGANKNSGNTSGAAGINTGTTGTTGTSDSINTTQDNSGYTEAVNTPAGGWDASGGWDTVGSDFPHQKPDLSSMYYRGDNPEGIQLAFGKVGRHGDDSIDCCFYARSRAMECRGWTKTYGSYTRDYDVDAIKNGDRVVRFNTGNYYTDKNGVRQPEMHFVYVEAYDSNTDTVYFSDANMGGSPQTDGSLKSRTLNDFLNYFPKGSYQYAEIP